MIGTEGVSASGAATPQPKTHAKEAARQAADAQTHSKAAASLKSAAALLSAASSRTNGAASFTSNGCVRREIVWRYGGNEVFLTGSFDNWTKSVLMKKDADNENFVATIPLNPHKSHTFKFVVDGVWRCSLDFQTTHDDSGNVNNILNAEASR